MADRSHLSRPSWFPTLTEVSPYFSIQVHPAVADTWREELGRFLADPLMRDAVDRHFLELRRFQGLHRESLQSTDWQAWSGHELLKSALMAEHLRYAIDGFLPPPYDQWPLDIKRWLFLLHLLLFSEEHLDDILSVRPGRETFAHEDQVRVLACEAIHSWLSAPFLVQAIATRQKQHVGCPAGILLFLQDMYRQLEINPILPLGNSDDIANDAIGRLREATWCGVSRRSDQLIDSAVDPILKKAKTLEATELRREELSARITETILARWGGLDGLNAIAHALDGKFNIAPRAVIDDIIQSLGRSPGDAAPRAEPFPPLMDGELKNNEYSEHIRFTIRVDETPYGDPVFAQALRRFIEAHPEHNDGITFLLSEEPNKSLAKRHCVITQTIINRRNKAKKCLKTWLTTNR